MKALSTLLTALILTAWIGGSAILAVQNFTPVSLRLLGLQSIQVPLGLVLAFSAGLGLVATAIATPLLSAVGEDFEDED